MSGFDGQPQWLEMTDLTAHSGNHFRKGAVCRLTGSGAQGRISCHKAWATFMTASDLIAVFWDDFVASQNLPFVRLKRTAGTAARSGLAACDDWSRVDDQLPTFGCRQPCLPVKSWMSANAISVQKSLVPNVRCLSGRNAAETDGARSRA